MLVWFNALSCCIRNCVRKKPFILLRSREPKRSTSCEETLRVGKDVQEPLIILRTWDVKNLFPAWATFGVARLPQSPFYASQHVLITGAVKAGTPRARTLPEAFWSSFHTLQKYSSLLEILSGTATSIFSRYVAFGLSKSGPHRAGTLDHISRDLQMEWICAVLGRMRWSWMYKEVSKRGLDVCHYSTEPRRWD